MTIAHKRSKKFDPEEDETSYFEEQPKFCKRCKQEYTGACPIGAASCPMENQDTDGEEEEEKDFDDVENLNEVLTEDKEADRLTEDEAAPPPGDLGED